MATVFLLLVHEIHVNGERNALRFDELRVPDCCFCGCLCHHFARAAFLDNRLRKAELARGYGFAHNTNLPPEGDGGGDKERTRNLYLLYAD
jgi:hypothetical protein